jgi:hypothetical protein
MSGDIIIVLANSSSSDTTSTGIKLMPQYGQKASDSDISELHCVQVTI